MFFIVSLALMIGYQSKLTSVLFVFSVALPAVSFVFLLLSSLLLKAEIKYRALSAEKLESTDIELTITNRFFMPLAPMEVIGYFPLKSNGTFEYQKTLISIPPFSSITIRYNTPIKYRGLYKSGIEKIVLYDLLKVFSISKKYDKFENMLILPRKFVIAPITDTGDSDSETASVNNFSLDKNAFAGIREYRTDDSIKHIHWTMSAKHDKMMVKQFERSIGGSCIIIADLNEYFPFDEDNAESCDCVIEVLLAINMSLISQKQCCINLWYSPADNRCEQMSIKNEEEFSSLFDTFSVLQRQKEIFLPESIAESCTDIPSDCSTVYFITSQIRREFITRMSSIELFKNKNIKILLIDSTLESAEQDELSDAVAASRGIELWRVDKNDIANSLNASIEFNR